MNDQKFIFLQVITNEKNKIHDHNSISKLCFVLYASIFEEMNRVRKSGKPNPRRLQLLGESARAAKREALLLQKKHHTDIHSAHGNIFDVPLRELGRLLWSKTKVYKKDMKDDSGKPFKIDMYGEDHSKWYYNIQRKDDIIMQMMLEQFSGSAGTFLTTPLGFAMRVGK